MREQKNNNTGNASVIRVIKDKNYTTVSNRHLFSKELSLKAKGLMTICLALPDWWNYNVAGLMSLSSDGRDSVTSALKTLEKEGFLFIQKTRSESGHFVSIYNFYENPEENPNFKQITVTENLLRENRNGETDADNPMQTHRNGSSDSENPELLNTNNEELLLNTNNQLFLVKTETVFTCEDLLNLYKKICIHFPQPKTITDERRKKAKLRLEKYPQKEFWEDIFRKAEKSKFIRSSAFFCFDWILKNDQNALKVSEGNYNNEEISENEDTENKILPIGKYAKCYK